MIGEVAAIASNLTEIRVGLGVHKHETYKNYWDITPEFVNRLNHLLELNDTMNVSMYAPYASFTKEDIVRDAVRLGVPYKKTWTCYDPVVQLTPNGVKYSPCLKCEACVERQQAGVHAGVSDVNSYQIKQITVTQ
jgi:7-cyano-7-deazaguanine synthase